MRGKLIAVAVAAGLAGGAAVMAVPDAAPTVTTGPVLALPVVAAHFNAADRMELTQAGQTLRLERRGQSWGLAREGGHPVRPEMIGALIDELQTLRLLHPEAAAAPLGDPADPANNGVLVRVISVSGDVLGALVLGGTANTARRPGETEVYATTPQVAVSADPTAWASRALPAPEDANVTEDGGLGAGSVMAALGRLRFDRALASPQVHLQAVTRTIRLALPDGDAVLRIGIFEGRTWLLVAGSSRWAARLAPYGFALPPGSPLVAGPGQSL